MKTLFPSDAGLPAETSYLSRHLAAIPSEGWHEALRLHVRAVGEAMASIPEDSAAYAYAPGKWTVRQVLGHVLDSQIIFSYRATCMARGERAGLPGFDENTYSGFWRESPVPLARLAEAYAQIAAATLTFAGFLTPEASALQGMANGISLTPEKVYRVLMGHERHHLRILSERYGLPGLASLVQLDYPPKPISSP